MKEEKIVFKQATNEVATQNRRWKLWHKSAAKPDPLPYPGPANALRATLLCMVLAHARGKLHCRTVWGKEPSRRVELNSLEDQRKFVEARMGEGYRPPLSEEERKIAKKLLDWGDIGRHVKDEPVAVDPATGVPAGAHEGADLGTAP
jgi:hypothetical protein